MAAATFSRLLVGGVLMIAAFVALALGVIADLIRINRILLEDSLEQQKRQRFSPDPMLEMTDLDPAWPSRHECRAHRKFDRLSSREN